MGPAGHRLRPNAPEHDIAATNVKAAGPGDPLSERDHLAHLPEIAYLPAAKGSRE